MFLTSCPYDVQKSKALTNNVAFELSYQEWIELWNSSGKWAQRGPYADDYCLARIDSTKGFFVGNCYVITNRENATEKQEHELVISVAAGQNMQQKRKDELFYGKVITPQGEFPSSRDAAAHYGITHSAMEKRIKSINNMDFYRVRTDGSTELKTGQKRNKKTSGVFQVRQVSTPMGIFDNAKLAAKAHGMSPASMNRRLNGEHAEFSYLESIS